MAPFQRHGQHDAKDAATRPWLFVAHRLRFAVAFRTIGYVCAVLALGLVSTACADTYPSRPITLVVTYPAGGGTDIIARVIANKLSTAMRERVIVENRGGGAGNIGARAVARAASDGYTLLLGHTNILSINPSMYPRAGYDVRKDFAPIGLIGATPVVLMVHPSTPAKTLPELVALAKAKPGALNAGVPVVGSGSYLAAEMFKAAAGVDMTIVSYKGTGPLTGDLIAGHVSVGFNTIAPSLASIRAGSLRALGVASKQRTSLLPDVPTIDESGISGFEAVLRYGLLAPAGTPRAIIERLNRELATVVQLPDVSERLAADGAETITSTPEEYATEIDREETRWGSMVRRLGLQNTN